MKKANAGEGALIGAAVGIAVAASVSGKRNAIIISALAGAVIGGAIGKQVRAKGNRIPYMVADSGSLFKVYPDGSRRKVRI
ncbi:hypothetical protein BH11BAC7_BH11BAC7_04860 [soil metagenome]